MIKMKFANILIALIMGSFVSAKAQYSYTAVFMDVGEEKTINLPSSVTNKDIKESYWSNDSPTYVKITRQSDYSVTIKILKYTSMTCLVQYDYYWGSSREHGNFSIRIDIKKPQSLVLSASPSGGTVAAGTSVKLEVTFNGNNVSGADIYYTTNGYSPSSYSNKYSSSGIIIDESCTLKAIAYKDGYSDSEVLTEYYTVIKDPTPTLSLSANPNGGIVEKGRTVYLTASNASADIYYTLNGSKPTTSSTKYTSSGITINEDCTLKAIAKNSGYNDSPVMTWIYSVAVAPTSISIVENLTMKLEDSYTISYTLAPDNAATIVSWNSDNKSVATINSDGKVKPVGIGAATIVATTSNGLTATCQLTIVDNLKPYIVNIDKIFTGDLYSMILKTDGSLWGWGCNTYNRIIGGAQTNILRPVKISDDIAYVSGNSCKMILKTDGSLWATGFIPTGLFNDISWDYSTFPGTLAKKVMDGVASVAVAEYHIHILKQDGSLWACGQNIDGVLGDGTTEKRTTPVKVMEGVKSVFAGYHHTMALKNDGTLWAWGQNKYGQLGDGTTERKLSPVKVMDGGVASVAASYEHTMILKTDGTLWACGNNYYGQLGDGTTSRRITPVQVMSGVKQVSSTWLHTMILKTNGSLWACGKNQYGELGDGTTTRTATPVKIMDDVASVAAANYHTIMLKTEGSLWACGDNRFGQLGDGTTVLRTLPVKIAEYGVEVTNITLNKTSLSLQPEVEETLIATVLPSNATNKTVTWSSSNESVAIVDNNGKVTAKTVGNTTITCSANDGSGVKSTCMVSVDKPVGIDINATNFPDANFRNYLLSQSYGQDGILTDKEIIEVTNINVNGKYISSLKGIEFFTALTQLWCYENQLTSLDVSKNTLLTHLYCRYNQLTSLGVSKNTKLTTLDCQSNQLTSLDVSKNTALTKLYCNNNQINGTAMDNLIFSLPQNTTDDQYRFRVIAPTSDSEGNICTKPQVAAVKAKGWIPFYYDGTEKKWLEYEGSDEVEYLMGDADGDGEVTAKDVLAVISYILGLNSNSYIKEAADMNDDGVVDIKDVTAIIELAKE